MGRGGLIREGVLTCSTLTISWGYSVNHLGHDGTLPVTEAQLGVWLAHLLDPSGVGYCGGQYLDITGEFDRDLLRRAVEHVVTREVEAMSMRLVDMAGEVRQVPMPEVPLCVETLDLTA